METLRTKIIKSPDSIEDAKSVRVAVFQVEQEIAQDIDFDGRDDEATHIVIYDAETPVGTGRMRQISAGQVKIERIAVLKNSRKLGIGRIIMSGIHEYLKEIGIAEATLDAQQQAKGFYEKLGYQQEGDVFEEAGIPHVVMTKKI